MAEYIYVTLPSERRPMRTATNEADASAELNEVWVPQGWEPVAVARPSSIGPIGFLLKREA